MQQHAAAPILLDDKFSGVLHECKGGLMILGGGLCCVERVGKAALSMQGDDQP
jgi:hypothetical protein